MSAISIVDPNQQQYVLSKNEVITLEKLFIAIAKGEIQEDKISLSPGSASFFIEGKWQSVQRLGNGLY